MTIRCAAPGDAAALLEIYRPYVENTAVSFEYDTPSELEFARRIAHTLESYPYLVLEDGGAVRGYAYAGPLKARAAYAQREKPVRLHRLGGGGGRLPDPRQPGFSRAYGLSPLRPVPSMRLEIRPLVRHRLDGKIDRRACLTPGKTLLSNTKKPERNSPAFPLAGGYRNQGIPRILYLFS